MATRYAVANGNSSSSSTWDGGTLPASTDDVFANGHTVSIDADFTVNSLRTVSNTTPAIAAGGSFQVTATATVTVTAGILAAHNASSSELLLIKAGSATVTVTTPNIVPANVNGVYGVHVDPTQTGTLAINANIAGGGGGTNSIGLFGESSAPTTITGNIVGGSGLSNGAGALFDYASGGTTVTIIGNVTGGSASYGVDVSSGYSGTMTITGNVIGGADNVYGVNFEGDAFGSGAHLVINGDVTPGTGYAAGLLINLNSADATIRGNIKQGAYGYGCPAIITTSGSKQLRLSGDIWAGGAGTTGGRHGYWPIQGCWVPINGEGLTVHLLDDTGFPASSGGTDVSLGAGGSGGPMRPATGIQWPLPR